MPDFRGPLGDNVLRGMWQRTREGFDPAMSDKILAASLDYVFTGVNPDWLPKATRAYWSALEPVLLTYRTKALNGTRKENKEGLTFSTTYDPAARAAKGGRARENEGNTAEDSANLHGKSVAKFGENSAKNDPDFQGSASHLPAETPIPADQLTREQNPVVPPELAGEITEYKSSEGSGIFDSSPSPTHSEPVGGCDPDVEDGFFHLFIEATEREGWERGGGCRG